MNEVNKIERQHECVVFLFFVLLFCFLFVVAFVGGCFVVVGLFSPRFTNVDPSYYPPTRTPLLLRVILVYATKIKKGLQKLEIQK